MKLLVGSQNPVKIKASENAVRTLGECKNLCAIGVDTPSGVPDQPMTESETRQGAINRVKYLRELHSTSDQDWCVAIEGGVDNFIDGPATFAYVVLDHKGMLSVGRSANLPLPTSFFSQLQSGQELGDVMDAAFQTNNVKQKGGAIGLLTHGHATRQSVYETALVLALSKFRFKTLF